MIGVGLSVVKFIENVEHNRPGDVASRIGYARVSGVGRTFVVESRGGDGQWSRVVLGASQVSVISFNVLIRKRIGAPVEFYYCSQSLLALASRED